MLYGTEACPVLSRHKHSLDFAVTRVFMKIMRTGSKETAEECQRCFGFLPVSHRTARFLSRFSSSENGLCGVFHDQAQRHMSELLAKWDVEVSSWHVARCAQRIVLFVSVVEQEIWTVHCQLFWTT